MSTDETQGDGVAFYRPPGRPGLSFSKVQLAADDLLREGVRPTVEKIRARVGGSPNTIIEHLDKWWASLAKRIEVGSEAFTRLPRSYAHLAESFFHQSMEEFRKLAAEYAVSRSDEVAAKAEDTRKRTLLLDERERELSEAIADRDQRIAALEAALVERSSQLVDARIEQQALVRKIGRLASEIRRMNERLLLNPIQPPSKRLRQSRAKASRFASQQLRRSLKATVRFKERPKRSSSIAKASHKRQQTRLR